VIGKEGPAAKVLSGTYENVAEVGTGRVALSMQRLRQGGIIRNDFNDFNDFSDFSDFSDFNDFNESRIAEAIPQRSIVPIYFRSFVFHVSSSKHHVSISAVAQKVNLGNLGVRNAMRPNERAFWASCDVRLSAIVGENVGLPSLFDMRS